jgi:hypothetical protein
MRDALCGGGRATYGSRRTEAVQVGNCVTMTFWAVLR